jgi:hypothetical protein
MPSGNDGKKPIAEFRPELNGYTTDKVYQEFLISDIKKLEETGKFATKEQQQYTSVMRAVKEYGGIDKLDIKSLKALNHIVKVLAGDQDKSIMAKDDANDFIKTISQKRSL